VPRDHRLEKTRKDRIGGEGLGADDRALRGSFHFAEDRLRRQARVRGLVRRHQPEEELAFVDLVDVGLHAAIVAIGDLLSFGVNSRGMGLVDEARWPLVVVNWSGMPSNDDLDEALRVLTSFYDRRHAVLHDGLRAGGLSAEQRRRMSRHSTTHEEEIRRAVVASAAVVSSTFLRGIIALVQWGAPSPTPFRVFNERAPAEEWLLHALRRAGLWRPDAPPISDR
jgi:hypothetical protein